jgi:ribosomal subunit interface protein
MGKEAQVELILRSRGVRVTDHIRERVKQKLAKVARLDPRVWRLEVELIGERNPRIDGSHRVEVAVDSARRVFRAQGAGHDVESALDQVVERLEKQITSYRGRVRDRRQAGAGPSTPSTSRPLDRPRDQ